MAKGTKFIVKHKYHNRRNFEDVLVSAITRKTLECGLRTGGKGLADGRNTGYNEDTEKVADFSSSSKNELVIFP